MILFTLHAFKRALRQKVNILFIVIFPIALIFIPPQPGDSIPFGVNILGLIGLFTGITLTRQIVDDRKNKTIIRIAASPKTHFDYLGGYLLAYTVIIFIQTIIFITALYIRYTTQVDYYSHLFILIFTFNMMAIALGLFWQTIIKNPVTSFALFTGFAPLIAIIGGLSMPLEFIEGTMLIVARFFPTYWLAYGLNALEQGIINQTPIVVLILLSYTGIFLSVGSQRGY